MIAYFDSSGLVKLLITSEVGAELASTTIRDAEQVATSVVAYPECRAAIAAAIRGSRLDRPTAQDAVGVLENLWLIMAHVLVSDDVARRAGEWLPATDCADLTQFTSLPH